MIPAIFITEWRAFVPWVLSDQVEQDLIISRALIEIYRDPLLQKKLAFRGGTALHKLHLSHPYRYSEDLDFIQIHGEAIGETFDALRRVLDPWLGEPRREQKGGLVRLQYRMESFEGNPLKLKIEINSREHFGGTTLTTVPYKINSQWFSGEAEITSLTLPWLMGSKLRALYQRKKGRDLFDIVVALNENNISTAEMVETFQEHLKRDQLTISRAEFEKNLRSKINDKVFNADLSKLLAEEGVFDFMEGFETVLNKVPPLLAGEPWKGNRGKETRSKLKGGN